MGSKLIAREAEGRMGYWPRGHKGEMNNCFGKIQLVGQKNNETKLLSLVKARKKGDSAAIVLVFQSRHFSLVVGYNIKPSRSSTNQNKRTEKNSEQGENARPWGLITAVSPTELQGWLMIGL